jgi:hypothetical protein
MVAAATAKRGNHRRTKSTHPDELNKMMLTLGREAQPSEPIENAEEIKVQIQELPQRHQVGSFTQVSHGGSFKSGQFFGMPPSSFLMD